MAHDAESFVLDDNAPMWRWNEVVYRNDNHVKPGRTTDPLVKRGCRFLRRFEFCGTPRLHEALRNEYPDIYRAHALHVRSHSERWLLESGILAGLPVEDLSNFTNVSMDVIQTYEALYFDVRKRKEHKGYVLSRILMPSVRAGIHERDYDLLYKAIAYFAGWDHLIEYLGYGPMTDETRSWVRTGLEDTTLRKGYAAAHRLEVNNYNSVEVLALILKLKEIETHQGAEGAQNEAWTALSHFLDMCTTSVIPAATVLDPSEPRASELMGGPPLEKYKPLPAGEPVHGKDG